MRCFLDSAHARCSLFTEGPELPCGAVQLRSDTALVSCASDGFYGGANGLGWCQSLERLAQVFSGLFRPHLVFAAVMGQTISVGVPGRSA